MTETAEPTTTAHAGHGRSPRRARLRGQAAADAAHPRDPRPARAQLLGARAGHPPAGRSRRARGLTRRTCSRTSPTRSSRSCRRSRTTPARSAGAAGSSPGCATGPGPATSPSTSRSSSRTSPAPTSATARRAPPGPRGQYNCIYEYREEAVGLEAGRMAVALVNHLVAPDDPEHLLRLRAGDGAPHPARRAPGLRAVDAGAHRRGGQPRHPVHPPRPPLARPVRPRRPPAAHPGDDDVADLGHRGRRGVRQEPDQPAARFGRPAGPARRRRRDRGGGGRRRRKRLGFPCVVKPLDGNHGRGVHLDLRSEEAVRAAFHGALAQSRAGDVVVETYVAGNDYRCLVIGGKVAAIAERVPASGHRRRRAHRPSSSSTSPTPTRAAASATRRS